MDMQSTQSQTWPTDAQSNQSLTYRNVMEALVTEEVEHQLRRLPPRVAKYINKSEILAFALNRLPTLYATSEKGWRQQCAKGRRDLSTQITTVVQQALTVIQRDPLRMEVPLNSKEQEEAQAALHSLRALLKSDQISWENVVDCVEQTLQETRRGQITWQRRNTLAGESDAWSNDFYRL